MKEQITIRDIARLSGVGVSTVSRAINDHPDVSEKTKEKIRAIIKEYHYIPNGSARNLKLSDAATVAVLVKGASNAFFTEMIEYIQDDIRQKNYSMVLHRVEFDEDEVDVALRLVRERPLRGIIFLGGYFMHTKDKLMRLSVPFVLATTGSVPDAVERESFSSVTVDDEAEARKLTEYLISLGHRRIAILGSSDSDLSVGKLRLMGYRAALKAHRIPYDKNLVIPMIPGYSDYSMENGYATVQSLLQSGEQVDAVFAISDTMAIGAMRAIHDAGMKVPEDIAVVGFDGVKAGIYSVPSLTTIRQPLEMLSHAASDILFDIIDHGASHQHRIFPAELVKRESTEKQKR